MIHVQTSAGDLGDEEEQEMAAYDVDLARDLSMLHQALKGVNLPSDLQALVTSLHKTEMKQRKNMHDSIEDLTDDKSVNGYLPYYTRQTRIGNAKSSAGSDKQGVQDVVSENGRISGMFVEADRLVRGSYEALNVTPTPLKNHKKHLRDDDSMDSTTTFYSYNNDNNYEVCSLNRQQIKNNKKTPLSFNNPGMFHPFTNLFK